jgi:hypothetical protein
VITDRSHSRDDSQKDEHHDLLPPEYLEKLRAVFLKSGELLRHFWGSFPITSPVLIAKARRLAGAIVAYYDDLENLYNESTKSSLEPKKEFGRHLYPILKSLNHAITHAQDTKLIQAK